MELFRWYPEENNGTPHEGFHGTGLSDHMVFIDLFSEVTSWSVACGEVYVMVVSVQGMLSRRVKNTGNCVVRMWGLVLICFNLAHKL
jgi:hypothetical protein